MAFVVGNLQAKLELDSRKFDRALDAAKGRGDKFARRFSRNMKKISRDISGVGREMTRQVTLPLLAVGAASIKAALDLETSFAGVKKTVEGTPEQLEEIRKKLRELGSTSLPTPIRDLDKIAELGGQLGIERENLLGFVDTIARIGDTTNLSVEEAATGFARLTAIMQTPQEKIANLGSAVVALGNNFATTEKEILEFSLRIAGAAKVVGIGEDGVFALAAAFTSVGIKAEAGGTAVSKTIFAMSAAVGSGGEDLKVFADIAGESMDEFAVRFKTDGADALNVFILGLRRIIDDGGDIQKVFKAIGLANDRTKRALLSSAGAAGLMTEALDLSSEAIKTNTALMEESEKRYETAASQLGIFKNEITVMAAEFGKQLVPKLLKATEGISTFLSVLRDLPPEMKKTLTILGLTVGVLGPLAIGAGAGALWIGRLIPIVGGAATAIGLLGISTASVGAMFATAGIFTAGIIVATGVLAFQFGPALADVILQMVGFPPLLKQVDDALRELISTAGSADAEDMRILEDPDVYRARVKAFNDGLRTMREQGKLTQKQFEELQIGLTTPSDRASLQLIANETKRRRILHDAIREGIRLRKEEADQLTDAAVTATLERAREEEIRLLEKKRKLEAESLAASRAAMGAPDVSEAEGIANRREILEIETAIHEERLQAAEDEAFIAGLFTAELDRQEKLQADGLAIRESVATVDERRVAELENAKLLFDELIISAGTYTRAIVEINNRYDEIVATAAKKADELAAINERAAKSSQRAFEQFLFDPLDDGFEGMVKGFADAIRRMIAQAAAAQIFGAFFGGGGGGNLDFGNLFPGGSANAADGGLISGRGTGTSDSNLIRVSDGEFVMTAAAVKRFGSGFFDRLNNSPVPGFMAPTGGFAAGGLVGAGAGVGPGASSAVQNVYNIDARGAEAGVELRIERAIRDSEDRAVARSVRTTADLSRRGGAFARTLR